MRKGAVSSFSPGSAPIFILIYTGLPLTRVADDQKIKAQGPTVNYFSRLGAETQH